MALRKVYVFVKKRTTMGKLKPGDMFCMAPTSKKDRKNVSVKEVFCAAKKPVKRKKPGSFEIFAYRLIKDPNFNEGETE